jgi:hypothetical protein
MGLGRLAFMPNFLLAVYLMHGSRNISNAHSIISF